MTKGTFRFVLRRIAAAILVVWLVATLAFVAHHLAPGDAASRFIDPRIPSEQVDEVRRALGLDRGLGAQYLSWLGHSLRGDLGQSLLYQEPTTHVIRRLAPATFLLGAAATGLGLLLGTGLGVLAAAGRRSWLDPAVRGVSLLLYSSPSFWLGLVLLLVFAGGVVHWFPGGGALPPDAPVDASMFQVRYVGSTLHHLILPALVLSIPLAVQIGRLLRFGLVEQMDRGYVRTARALGHSEAYVWRRMLHHSAGPVVQVLGVWLPVLFTGTVVVERVFSWPGLGAAAVDAIAARDVPLVLALTSLSAVAVIFGNLIADLVQARLDPRSRRLRLGSWREVSS